MRVPLLRTLSGRIVLGFTVLTLTFGTISALLVRYMGLLTREIRLIRTGYVPLALEAKDLSEKQSALYAYVKDELSTEIDPEQARRRIKRLRDQRSRALRGSEKLLDELNDIPPLHHQPIEETRQLVSQISEEVGRTTRHYRPLLDTPPLRRLEGTQQTTRERNQYILAKQALERLITAETEVNGLITVFTREQSDLAANTALTLERNERQLRKFAILTGLAAVLIGLMVTVWATMTLRPLQRLRQAARRIAEGDYGSRIAERGPAEVADLAREFNTMGQAVEEREREIVRQERLVAVGKMAAMITHEVRNPLSAIGLNTELLEEELGELGDADEARSLCRAITTEVDRLTAITEEYLQFARLPRPKRQLEDVGAIARNLADFQREPLAMRGVELVVELADQLPDVLVDESQLRQALLNLLRNAADAVAETGDGTVTIESRLVSGDDGDQVEIAVGDTGPGIPEDVAPRLFDPFVSSKQGGTGLGLALTQQIIREHGGDIRVESSPGKGATFTIMLPAARGSA